MKTINGIPEYTGTFVSWTIVIYNLHNLFTSFLLLWQDVWKQLIQKEGFFSLWKGFTPYYARLGPHTVLTFIFLEQFRKLYYNAFKSEGIWQQHAS